MEIDIKALRKRLGWSQFRLGEYLGVDRSTLSRLERGERPPSGPVQRLLERLIEEKAA